MENRMTEITKVDSSIVRVCDEVLLAYEEYIDLQKRLDAAMPEAMVRIGRSWHRTKKYWRAVATALAITVERLDEEGSNKGTNDETWIVTYRATAPNGRFADGDGACSHFEKRTYAKNPNGSKRIENGMPVIDPWATAQNATTHNIRGHASTRAYNRAVSNLVGFGEVSAEEMFKDEESATAPKTKKAKPKKAKPKKAAVPAPDPTPVPAVDDVSIPAPDASDNHKEAPKESTITLSKVPKEGSCKDPKIVRAISKIELLLTEQNVPQEWWEDTVFYASNECYSGGITFFLRDLREGRYSYEQILPVYGVLKGMIPQMLQAAKDNPLGPEFRSENLPF